MPDGSTAQVQAVEATYRGFADAAVECVKEWNYKPAIKDGKRVNCLMMVPIAFYPPSPKDDKFVPSDSKPATTPKAVPTTGIYAPVPKHDPVITGDYITVDKADVRPVPQFRDKLPPYPPELKGISGRAKVAFIVTTDGSTAQVQAVEATHRGFADAAEECFKKPRFKPAIKDGKTVNCLMILPMGFVQTSVDGKTEDFIILETPHLHAAP
jgi:TonB family protein